MGKSSDKVCDTCGGELSMIGDHKNTRLFMCSSCFEEKVQFIEDKTCKHEYDDRNGNKCTLCGEPSINYA